MACHLEEAKDLCMVQSTASVLRVAQGDRVDLGHQFPGHLLPHFTGILASVHGYNLKLLAARGWQLCSGRIQNFGTFDAG